MRSAPASCGTARPTASAITLGESHDTFSEGQLYTEKSAGTVCTYVRACPHTREAIAIDFARYRERGNFAMTYNIKRTSRHRPRVEYRFSRTNSSKRWNKRLLDKEKQRRGEGKEGRREREREGNPSTNAVQYGN